MDFRVHYLLKYEPKQTTSYLSDIYTDDKI